LAIDNPVSRIRRPGKAELIITFSAALAAWIEYSDLVEIHLLQLFQYGGLVRWK